MPIIRGIGFDFDGSLAVRDQKGNIIEVNGALLDSIKAENNKYEKTVVFCASNRQSASDDLYNAKVNGNGSCYIQIKEVSDYLEAEFDPFLLADLYNDLESGTTFKQACSLLNDYDYDEEKFNNTKQPEWLRDESKLSLLLAQIHKLASENPNDEIEFFFYDDRQDILDALSEFFKDKKNWQYLPKNLKALHLVPYPPIENKENNTPLSYEPIRGTGKIRFDFVRMIKKMATACISQFIKSQKFCPANADTTEAVTNFKEAEQADFNLTQPMNFARDCNKATKGLLSFFSSNNKEEKEKEKELSKQEKKLAKKEKKLVKREKELAKKEEKLDNMYKKEKKRHKKNASSGRFFQREKELPKADTSQVLTQPN